MIPFVYTGNWGEPGDASVLMAMAPTKVPKRPSRAELRQDVDRVANEHILHASESIRQAGYPTREEYDAFMDMAHEAADEWREHAGDLLKEKKLDELADEIDAIDRKIAFSRANLRTSFGDHVQSVPK